MKNVRGAYRANVSYRAERSALGRVDRKGEYLNSFNFYDSIPAGVLKSITPRTRVMLKNRTCTIQRCQKCGFFSTIARKTWLKIKRPMIRRYGGYACINCCRIAKGKEPYETKDPERKKNIQDVFKKCYEAEIAYLHKGNAFNSQVHTRIMTEDERKLYGLG